jgi:hypothetical protein
MGETRLIGTLCTCRQFLPEPLRTLIVSTLNPSHSTHARSPSVPKADKAAERAAEKAEREERAERERELASSGLIYAAERESPPSGGALKHLASSKALPAWSSFMC